MSRTVANVVLVACTCWLNSSTSEIETTANDLDISIHWLHSVGLCPKWHPLHMYTTFDQNFYWIGCNLDGAWVISRPKQNGSRISPQNQEKRSLLVTPFSFNNAPRDGCSTRVWEKSYLSSLLNLLFLLIWAQEPNQIGAGANWAVINSGPWEAKANSHRQRSQLQTDDTAGGITFFLQSD